MFSTLGCRLYFCHNFVWFPSLYKDIKLLYVPTLKMQVLLILIYFCFPDIVVLDCCSDKTLYHSLRIKTSFSCFWAIYALDQELQINLL